MRRRWRSRRHRRRANTGPGAASPNGWWSGLPRIAPTLVGIDHGFSFPLRYFEAHGLMPDWPAFLDDFQHHWPTDDDHAYVDFVREGMMGNGAARTGSAPAR